MTVVSHRLALPDNRSYEPPGVFRYLEDFPQLKIVTHHVGAMIPMLAGRIENGLRCMGAEQHLN